MTTKLASLSLGLALIAGGALPALAGDWRQASSKDYGAAVPVPAPVPVPIHAAEWYIRGDVGYVLGSRGTVDSWGATPVPTIDPQDMNGPWVIGVGFGRYITPSIRGEFSLNFRNDQKVVKRDNQYVGTITEQIANGSFDTHSFDIDRGEQARIGSHTALISFYYDFKNHTAFTPYVGAGAGVSLHVFKRRATEHAECTGSVNSVTGAYPGCTASTQVYNSESSSVANGWGVAAALMAGFAYEVAPGIQWDTGYRYMWQNGKVSMGLPAFPYTSGAGVDSTIQIGNRTDHEIRTGLRFDLF